MARTLKADPEIEIIRDRLARRDLNMFQRCELALKLAPLIAAGGKKNQTAALAQAAADAVVSSVRIERVRVIMDRADEETKDRLRRGETSINAVYTDIQREGRREVQGDRERGEGLTR